MQRSLALLSQVVSLAMVPIMLVSIWLHVQVLDTDRYTESMRELGSDASFQQAFGDRVTRLLNDEIAKLNLASIQSYVDELGGIDAVYAAIESGVDRLVQSPNFVPYWVQINQVTHQELIAFIRGESSLLSSDNRRGVSLNLETIAAWVDPFTSDAASAVLSLAMADGATQVQIAESRSFPPAEWISRHSLAVAIGSIAVFALFQALAIALSRNRRRATTIAAIGVALVSIATVVFTKTLISDHLASIRDAQGRELAREYIDAILSDFVTLASVLGVASLLLGAGMVALPYIRTGRSSGEISAAMPQA